MQTKSIIKDKKIVLIDDSIVRGTTAIKIVQMMKDAGAKEVHMRISSPPIKFPDYYGIDTPTNELIAFFKKIYQRNRKISKIDSLHFLSLDGLYKFHGTQ